MKRTKLRIGCLLLVLVLLLGVLPVTALAVNEYTITGKLFFNGQPVYKQDGTSHYLTTIAGSFGDEIDYTRMQAWAVNQIDALYTDGHVSATATVYKDGGTYAPEVTFGEDGKAQNYVWVDVVTEYNVYFYADNLDTPYYTQTVPYGGAIQVPSEPVKEGFSFIGWYDLNDTPLDPSAPITSTQSYFAAWEPVEVVPPQPVTYTVTFNSNGGSPVKQQIVEEGDTAALPPEPTRENYTFKGWYSNEALSIPYDFNTEVYDNITLYAKWELKTPAEVLKYYVGDNFPGKIEVGTYQDVKVSIWGDRGVTPRDGLKLLVSVEAPRYSNADLWYYVGYHTFWDYRDYVDVVAEQRIPETFDLTEVGTSFPLSLYVDTAGTYKFTFTLMDGNTVLATDTATVEAYYPAHDDYRIYLDSGKHGSISTSPSTWADYQDAVIVYVNPDKGYELDTLKVYDARGNLLKLYVNNHGNYFFYMPNRSVTVYATFKAVNYDHFTDVPKDSWYYDAVYYVYDHDIMDGIGNRTFNPYGDLSRAMIVTTLYRMEGEPRVRTSGSFRDVPENTWYTDAVEWAAHEGIVKGYGKKTFGPSNSVTLEQLVAILQRYADYKGYDVDDAVRLYADAVVSQWAVGNVRWAVAEGLLRDGRSVNATRVATRAEIAYALYGFMTNVAK